MRNSVKKQIKDGTKAIAEVMQLGLAGISESIIKKVMTAARQATPSTILSSIKGITPSGVQNYKKEVLFAIAFIANEALKQARQEVPKAAKVKLSETNYFDETIKLGVSVFKGEALFNSLPVAVRKRIKAASDLLVDTQISDLEKSIFFQFSSSAKATDSMAQLEFETKEAAIDFIESNSIMAGAEVTAANTVNESRNAFFMEDEVLEQIDAFQFMNGDPVTPICQSLDGIVFAKDDPDMFKYTPPLHWNCKSWIEPILKGDLGKKEIEKLKSKHDDQIQFSEIGHACEKCSAHHN